MKKDLGILMHISSLPSKYGVGTLGKEAYKFVDFLKQNKLNLWQILPLNVTSFGDSPYQSPSNFGLNYYFIDLDILINKGLLKEEEKSSIKFFDTLDRVNYEYQYNNRLNVLRIAYNRFDKSNKKFNTFLKRKDYRDFAFFMVLKRINYGRPWYQFDDEYKTYSKKLETKIIKDYKNAEIVIDKWPKISPYIEIEGPTLDEIMEVVYLLGYKDSDVKIVNTDTVYLEEGIDIYKEEYNNLDFSKEEINIIKKYME